LCQQERVIRNKGHHQSALSFIPHGIQGGLPGNRAFADRAKVLAPRLWALYGALFSLPDRTNDGGLPSGHLKFRSIPQDDTPIFQIFKHFFKVLTTYKKTSSTSNGTLTAYKEILSSFNE
jgi:hypothetical protein